MPPYPPSVENTTTHTASFKAKIPATEPPTEQLAVIHDAHLAYENGPCLFFSTFIDEHKAADQWLPLIPTHAMLAQMDRLPTDRDPIDNWGTPATILLDAYRPKQPADLNGRPVWVTVDRSQNTIRYSRPYIRKEINR